MPHCYVTLVYDFFNFFVPLGHVKFVRVYFCLSIFIAYFSDRSRVALFYLYLLFELRNFSLLFWKLSSFLILVNPHAVVGRDCNTLSECWSPVHSVPHRLFSLL